MKKFLKIVCVALLMFSGLLYFCLVSLGDGLLHVYYLNIGQGDSVLVKTPGMEYILVDGGADDRVLQELGDVLPFYERTIDVLMVSHPHADHIDGLIDVLERYYVRYVMVTGVSYHYSGYDRFFEVVRAKGVPIVFVSGRTDYRLGSVFFDIVYPFESLQGAYFENINNSSISFRLLYRNTGFYFSGDLEMEGERKLVLRGLDLSADVFKAGHHGSRTSNTEDLLDLVKPLVAVISCGIDNPFKHPHPETIRHFQERGIKIFRTDLDGRVEIVSDGVSLTPLLF